MDFPKSWGSLVPDPLAGGEENALRRRVEAAYAAGAVFPPREELFTAFALTPPEAVRVVLLGQDPYHEPGQAHGLAFSVRAGTPLPPSLKNIYAELKSDLGVSGPADGDLRGWARQGVLLLNAVLTVRCGAAGSHGAFGWQVFTDQVIAALGKLPQPIVFFLWGAQAQKKQPLAENAPYPRLVLSAPHPSPLSAYRGFFGSRPFSQANAFLEKNGQSPIDWGKTSNIVE